MRLVFIGTAQFAVPSLNELRRAGHEIALVVTQPDRPGNRLKLSPTPIKVAAAELSLEVIQPERIREPEATLRIRAAGPELIVVVAYGQIIPKPVLELAVRGVVNVHGSLLPAHRGAAPVAYSLLAGDRVTGVTIMRMDEQLDHGPILARREVGIDPGEDAAALTGRLAAVGAQLLVETIPRLDEIIPEEQDHRQASLAPKIRKAEGDLEWELPAVEIDRRVRAFTPWPGVTLPFGAVRVKVLRGRPEEGIGRPGEVLLIENGALVVAAGRGAYRLEEVQLAGRRPMAARMLVSADG